MPTNPTEIDAQKAALVNAIAQQGSVGQQAFAAEAARRQAAQAQAVNQLAGTGQMTGSAGSAPAAFMKQLQAAQGDNYGVYAQDAAMSGQSFANSIAASKAAGASYMDAAKAALPLVNAQTAGTVAQIRAEQAAAEQDRQLARERMAFEREQMDYERGLRDQDKKDEADNERLDNLMRETAFDHPAVGTALAEIDQAGYSPQQALRIASRLIDAQKDATGAIPGFTKDDRVQLYRRIYEYYSGKKAPASAQALGEAFAKEGLDPELVPFYTTPLTPANAARIASLRGQTLGISPMPLGGRADISGRTKRKDVGTRQQGRSKRKDVGIRQQGRSKRKDYGN